jgi:hypothetical protein
MNPIFSLFSNFGVFFRNLCSIFIFLYAVLTQFLRLFFGNLCLFLVNSTWQHAGISLCSLQKKRRQTPSLFHILGSQGIYLARDLLASAISWKMPACFLDTIALMTSRVATISTQAMMRQMTTFWMIPARMKLTNATPATVRA